MQNEVRFVRYNNNNDNRPKHSVFSLEEFFTYLSEHEETDCNPCPGGKKCRKKDGSAWAPGWIPPGDDKTRRGYNVESFDVLAFDIDHVGLEALESTLERFDNFVCAVYSTHSHKPEKNDHCVRIVFALSRRISADEYLPLWHAVVRTHGFQPDPKAKDPSRLFFMPRAPRGAPRINVVNFDGLPIDVDALLADQHRFSREQHRVAQHNPPPAVEAGEVDLDSLRKSLRNYNPDEDETGEKREMVRRVVEGEPLADKDHGDAVKFDGPPIKGRDTASFRIGKILGRFLPLGTPVEAVEEILRPSLMSIPAYDDDEEHEGGDFWVAKAKNAFEVAQKEKLAEADANTRAVARVTEIARAKTRAKQRGGKSLLSAAPKNPDPEEPEPEESTEEPAEEDEWRALYKMRVDKSGRWLPDQIGYNVAVVLQHHPAWLGSLRFNEVTKDVECSSRALLKEERSPAQLLTSIENWLQYEEDLDLSSSIVEAEVFHVARKNSFDPLKDYLSRLEWDGVVRLPTFLEKYCGARLVDDDENDVTNYVRAVGLKWFIATAARGLNPGCKVDNVLVLEGKQGVGKSAALRALGGEWFTDSPMVLNDKDSKMLAAQSWIVELAELSAMRKVETEAQKAFFSAIDDKLRPPYGRVIETFLRRCVFVGTTNEDSYLHDSTGNRRFWPVCCDKFDLVAIRRDRDQLWAEAVHRFNAGEKYWFEQEDSADLEAIVSQRLKGSGVVEAISEWWSTMEPTRRPVFFTVYDVALEALNVPKHQVDEKGAAIGRALKKLGFEKDRRPVGGKRTWGYASTDEQRAMEHLDSRIKRKLNAGKEKAA